MTLVLFLLVVCYFVNSVGMVGLCIVLFTCVC